MKPYNFIITLVKDAGELLLRQSKEVFAVTMKNNDPRDIVTAVDIAVNDFLVSTLKKEFPTYGIYSEEGSGETKEGEYMWTIDPVDGSSNFARHIPHFAICIGLLHKGVPILGVVYNPVTRELFSFEKGRGAFLNGIPIRVSNTTSLKDAYVILHIGRKEDVRDWGLALQRKFLESAKKNMNLGSSALDLAFLACGRIDAVVYGTMTTQDIAVAVGLVREAGGEVYDIEGNPITLKSIPQQIIGTSTKDLFNEIVS